MRWLYAESYAVVYAVVRVGVSVTQDGKLGVLELVTERHGQGKAFLILSDAGKLI